MWSNSTMEVLLKELCSLNAVCRPFSSASISFSSGSETMNFTVVSVVYSLKSLWGDGDKVSVQRCRVERGGAGQDGHRPRRGGGQSEKDAKWRNQVLDARRGQRSRARSEVK